MPSFSETPQRRTIIIQARVTPTENEVLLRHCASEGIKTSDVLRRALDLYFAQLSPTEKESAGSGSKLSGSRKRPSASTAKVKATGKRSPSKSQ